MSSYRRTEYEERDYGPPPRREEEVRTRTVVRERERDDRPLPQWLRDDRRPEGGQMILRERDVEEYEHIRSPSPVRLRDDAPLRRPRSVSVGDQERVHTRTIVEERIRSPNELRPPSPRGVRFERRVERSPSTVDEREHIHIVDRRSESSSSRSPSPAPRPVVRGPIIERDVITHYTDIDHGVINARRPAPTPPRRIVSEQRETDIDISLGRHHTDVDIHRSSSRHRSRSRDGRRFGSELVVHDTSRLEERLEGRRRAHSAVGFRERDEEEYITSRIDSRGSMGEARGGATRKWTIVDVPPGTERVRMDGVGGASTDTTWSKYSGVRRTKFIPERDGLLVPSQPRRSRSVGRKDRLSVDIDIERHHSRHRSPKPPTREMWTELTKDLVSREAMQRLGYAFEETKYLYYIMQYLPYDEVVRLIEFSEQIRRARRKHLHALEVDIDIERRRRHHDDLVIRPRPRRAHQEWDRELIVDDRVRGYLR